MHNDISVLIGCQVATPCRCARAGGQGATRARAYEAAPGAAVQNVHADEPETSNVTFPMTVMGFVHLDDRGTTRCTLRAIPLPYPAAVDVRAARERTLTWPRASSAR